jgi:hypothetical protein
MEVIMGWGMLIFDPLGFLSGDYSNSRRRDREPPTYTDLDAVLIRETTKAGLFRFKSGKEIWLPWSQVQFTNGKVSVPDWLCANNGLYGER